MAKETKIYTRTGDKGFTALVSGKRIAKSDPQLCAYGSVDELNSSLGVLRCEAPDKSKAQLIRIQNLLFNIGSRLACDTDELRAQMPEVADQDVKSLEDWIDEMNKELPALKDFILPGGSRASAFAQLARTICRRSERDMLRYFDHDGSSEPILIIYLNRLSDYLFILARYLNLINDVEDTKWTK